MQAANPAGRCYRENSRRARGSGQAALPRPASAAQCAGAAGGFPRATAAARCSDALRHGGLRGAGSAGLRGAPQPRHLPAGGLGARAAAADARGPAGPHRAGALRGRAQRVAAAALPAAALPAIRACFLGFVFGCGVLLSLSQSSWNHFGWYMCSLSLFHYSEYLVTAVNNPKSLSLDSFLLNHSLEYTVAALSSWIEFTLENIFWPELKQITWLSATGLLMVVFGECLRKAAMFTAGSNFNHVVQNEKSDTHTLVTSGVYAWFRHPSYVGWFYWSIGTQVMLCNPICGVGYALTVWRFFRDRIEEEEISLIHFFGEEYLEYKKRVPTGLPFIKGVKVEL
ncbi:protein-S-isoprenylcysteine O-methyltransferase isoform X1 [Choloepus didactylus]|uniref:protein-S-isoprenylcysteine O-methyltransferase isoform X1 n=1 Tax=Choloepus didactylus TaxID=27675 RepID=UPI0018A0EF6E|nr:protein-S-isoprenylcysteine O-methyltransferase isoform X1 [Choloepus didactylus]